MEQYDMDAVYLYNDGWQYRIGKIQKVNDKSIRMDYGTKIPKEVFKDAYKLTEEELKIFNKEMVKKLSNSISEIKLMTTSIQNLKKALDFSELSCIDSTKLQNKLDVLNTALEEELKPIKIGGKKLTFNDYSERLIEAENE